MQLQDNINKHYIFFQAHVSIYTFPIENMASTSLLPDSTTAMSPSSDDHIAAVKEDDSWSQYNLDWLFDSDRLDHLSIEEQMKFYKQRNLKKTKLFKRAAEIFGAPASRKRVIVAPPLYTSWYKEGYPEGVSIDKQFYTSSVIPPKVPEQTPSTAEIRGREERAKFEEYQNWVSDRRKFRKDLDSLGLSEEWLSRKLHKTALEQRVLTRMIAERTNRPPTPPVSIIS